MKDRHEEEDELAETVMIRRGDWKYIQLRRDIDELYDLGNDPGEMRNLAGDAGQAERVAALREGIRKILGASSGLHAWCMD